MLGLNPYGRFNEHDLNPWCRRLALHLHQDAAAKNRATMEQVTTMFQPLGNARDLLCYCFQNNKHHIFLGDVQDSSDNE